MAELTEKSQIKGFDGWAKIIFLAGMLIFAFHACTHMVAAGDTWVAMACGRHYANHPVDTVEPFSANSHKPGPTEAEIRNWPGWAQSIAKTVGIEAVRKWHPTGWINQNWLTHLIFYKLATFGQEPGHYNYDALVWWKFITYLIAAFCIYYTSRLMGVSVPGSALASAMGLFIGRTFIDIRPAGYANLLVTVYLLVLALTVYKNYRWIWLLVPVTVFWANVHGGYIYVFIMLVPFVALNFISIPFKQRLYSIGLKGILHAIGAGAASLIAMILFNPYKLTNLTHTFEISISKHAESWRRVNEWRPAFQWDNPVGDEIPFTVMFAIGWVFFLVWFVVWAFVKPIVVTNKKQRKSIAPVEPKPGEYVWKKANLSAIVIAGLTVYMAVKSRRFIPLGGEAACPVIMLFIEQAVEMLMVRFNFNKNKKIVLPPLPPIVSKSIIGVGLAVVIIFGTVWGVKFQHVYLSPWPTEASRDYNPEKRDSVFMRMTASNIKPFDVCQFIRENNVSGNMFNYWTEGGAIAFGQTPDEKTGKTPLQLFMDGRAQAAYNHDTFVLWQIYYMGGPDADMARRSGRFATDSELEKIGNWLDERMKTANIWVFVLPNDQFSMPRSPQEANYFARALSMRSNWKLAYVDDSQQMYVDTDDPRGKNLLEHKVMSRQAKFPNEYVEKLTLARLYAQVGNAGAAETGFEMAKEAFEMNPSQMSMANFMYYAARPDYALQSIQYVDKFINELDSRNESFMKQGGSRNDYLAGMVGCNFLSSYYERADNTKSKHYNELLKKFTEKRNIMTSEWVW